MNKRLLAAALVLLPIGTAAVTTYAMLRRPVDAFVDFERHYEDAFVSGFHDHEVMDGRGNRWTTGDAFLQFENLPVASRLRVEVRLKGQRPPGVELPHIRITANGVTIFETMCDPGLVTYRFGVTLPGSSLRLGIHPETYVPAGGNDRVLGVQLFSVLVQPRDGQQMLGRPVAFMALAGALLLGAGLAAGLSIPIASLAATVLSAGFVFMLQTGSVRFLPYCESVAMLAMLTLVVALLVRACLSWARWPETDERPFVVAVVAASFLLKMGVLFFPLFVSSDADFHANRLLDVLGGDFHTTSVTQHQPPFLIPYPVSLYVLAAPLAFAGVDRLSAIKALIALFDVSSVLVLVYVSHRFLGDLRAGLVAAVLYSFVPLNWYVLSAGNFTNAFGVATTTLFVGFLLASWAAPAPLRTAGTSVFSLLALTSHFGTFLFGVLLWPGLLAAVLWLARGEGWQRHGRRVVVSGVLTSGLLALLYYAGYWELMTAQWERILTPDYASGAATVDGPLAKLAFNIPSYRHNLGIAFGLLALWGGISILRRPRSSLFHAAAAVWIAVTVVFFFLDLFTALEVRYLLQTVPLFAVFAGWCISGALRRGWIGQAAAWAVMTYLAVSVLPVIYECMVYRYH